MGSLLEERGSSYVSEDESMDFRDGSSHLWCFSEDDVDDESSQEAQEVLQPEEKQQKDETTRRDHCIQDTQFSSEESYMEGDYNFLLKPDPRFDNLLKELGIGCDGEWIHNKDKLDDLVRSWNDVMPILDCTIKEEEGESDEDNRIERPTITHNRIPDTSLGACHEEYWPLTTNPASYFPAEAGFPFLLGGEEDTWGNADEDIPLVEPEVELPDLTQSIVNAVDAVSRCSLEDLAESSRRRCSACEENGPVTSFVSQARHTNALQDSGWYSAADVSTTHDIVSDVSALTVSFASVSLSTLERELCVNFFTDEGFTESLKDGALCEGTLSLPNSSMHYPPTNIHTTPLTALVWLEERMPEAVEQNYECGDDAEKSPTNYGYQSQYKSQTPVHFYATESPTGARSSPEKDQGIVGSKQREKDADRPLPSSDGLAQNLNDDEWLNDDAQHRYLCSTCGKSFKYLYSKHRHEKRKHKNRSKVYCIVRNKTPRTYTNHAKNRSN